MSTSWVSRRWYHVDIYQILTQGRWTELQSETVKHFIRFGLVDESFWAFEQTTSLKTCTISSDGSTTRRIKKNWFDLNSKRNNAYILQYGWRCSHKICFDRVASLVVFLKCDDDTKMTRTWHGLSILLHYNPPPPCVSLPISFLATHNNDSLTMTIKPSRQNTMAKCSLSQLLGMSLDVDVKKRFYLILNIWTGSGTE